MAPLKQKPKNMYINLNKHCPSSSLSGEFQRAMLALVQCPHCVCVMKKGCFLPVFVKVPGMKQIYRDLCKTDEAKMPQEICLADSNLYIKYHL